MLVVTHRGTYSKLEQMQVKVREGSVLPDTRNDILPMAIIERYKRTGKLARALVHGFGIRQGAIAATDAHDHHNIAVLGASLEDMAHAVNKLAECGGGLIVVRNSEVLSLVELPLAGLLADKSVTEMRSELDKLDAAVSGLGCGIPEPLLTLGFFVTPHLVPSLAMTDRGLVDVNTHEFVQVLTG